LGSEIVSADSRQIYKYLDIGTAKPALEQRRLVRHHFVDELLPDQLYSAGRFGTEGRRTIDEIYRRGRIPVVTGGSGLYIRSLIDGLFEGPAADPEIREILEQRVTADGIGSLLEELKRFDPVTAAVSDLAKPRRIIRALEVYYLTGTPLSKHHAESVPRIGFTPLLFGLEWERSDLYRRIELRCEEMLRSGLLKEIEKLEGMGYDRKLNALNTVGYAEGFAYRAGEMSFEEMVRLFKQNSRQFAKRQLTWFRKDQRIRWVKMAGEMSAEEVAGKIANLLGINV